MRAIVSVVTTPNGEEYKVRKISASIHSSITNFATAQHARDLRRGNYKLMIVELNTARHVDDYISPKEFTIIHREK